MDDPPVVVRRGPGRPPLNRNKLNPPGGAAGSTPHQWNNANNRLSASSSSSSPQRATNVLNDPTGYVPPHLHPAYRGRGRPPLSLGRRQPPGNVPPPTQSSTKPVGYVPTQQRHQQHVPPHQQAAGGAQRSASAQQNAVPGHLRQGHATSTQAANNVGRTHAGPLTSAVKEPSYISAGPTNRLLLSLKSGLPAHVQWALARLIQTSVQNVDALVLDAFPGLLETLVRFPRQLISAIRAEDREKWDPLLLDQEERLFDGLGMPFKIVGEDDEDQEADDSEEEGEESAQESTRALHSSAKPAFQPQAIESHRTIVENAIGAMLVLRNTSLFERNERTFLHNARTLNALTADILALPTSLPSNMMSKEWSELAGIHELRIYALDLLELTRTRLQIQKRVVLHFDASGIPASPPVVSELLESEISGDAPASAQKDGQISAPPSKTVQVSNRIFGLLVWLLHSTNDRTMLISCLRCLGALAAEDRNEGVFVEVEVSNADGTVSTSPGIVRKCLSLLPLTHDAALLESALDCLYQTMNVGDNALRIGLLDASRKGKVLNNDIVTTTEATRDPSRSIDGDVRSIVRFLARDLIYGRVVWDRVHQLQLHPALHEHIPSVVNGRRRERDEIWRKRKKLDGNDEKETVRQRRLNKEEWTQIKDISEPERLKVWMCTIYEAREDGEVTQMEFWATYSSQFGPYSQLGGPPLLPAAEVIRSVSSIFPGALAMVLPDKRFIVRGVQPRDRGHLRRFECRWTGCASPETDSLAAVESHVQNHVAEATESVCRWAFCAYAVPHDALDVKSHLLLHAKTHLPETEEAAAIREARLQTEQRTKDLVWKSTLKSKPLSKAEMPNGARYISGPTALMPFSVVGNEWRRIEGERQDAKRRKAMNLPTRGTIDMPDILAFSVTRTPMDPQTGRPTGIASTAALILRCLSRIATSHLAKAGDDHQRVRGGPALLDDDDDEERGVEAATVVEERFGLPLPPMKADQDTATGENVDNGVARQFEWMTEAAERITDSIMDVEEDLIQIASENDILCPILNETLANLRPEMGQSINRAATSSKGDAAHVVEQEDVSMSLVEKDGEQ